MSGSFPLLTAAVAEQIVFFWDLNRISQNNFEPMNVFKSSVSTETSSIACFGDAKGVIIGAIEGRACVKNIDLNTGKFESDNDFVYKCHRRDEGADIAVFACQGVAFNKQFNTFATVGGDGTCCVWDKNQKQKLTTVSYQERIPITAVAFTESAGLLAIAHGYDWH